MKEEKPFNEIGFAIMVACILGAPMLIGALKNQENDFRTRQLRFPVTPMAQRSCTAANAQDGISPAPEKLFQVQAPGQCPLDAQQDDKNMTKELINGFYSPVAPGGIGE